MAAVEPVIGHLKAEHRMGRNYLGHSAGDAINAVLAAVGYNIRLPLKWLALLCAVVRALPSPGTPRQSARSAFFTDDWLSSNRRCARRASLSTS